MRQRAANVGRAKKMHEARLLSELASACIAAPLETSLAFSKSAGKKRLPAANLFIGCSGWFYWHWRDVFYPVDTPTKQWFQHYMSHFNTVELNAPFYSWPTVAAVKTWIRQAQGRQFVYTVKVCELITHIKRMSRTKELVRDFGFIADLLGPYMGCFLFQFPPSFQYSAARLRRIVEQLDPSRRNVVEFRHRSWWNHRVYDAFRETGTIFCSCSGPRLPDELIKTADDIYIRFHGTKRWYRHDYSDEELAAWAARIRESGATNVYAYFNNDREANAIRNAKELARQLERCTRREPGDDRLRQSLGQIVRQQRRA